MNRNREWNWCPMESTAATARYITRQKQHRAQYEMARLAPTPVLKFIAEKIVPWERAFRQANPWLCTDDDLWAAFEQSHLFPELRRIFRENEAEYTTWHDACKVLEAAL